MVKQQKLVLIFLVLFLLLPKDAISRLKILRVESEMVNSISDAFDKADLIVYGRVEKIEKVSPTAAEKSKYEMAYASLRIEKVIKGEPKEKVISIVFWPGLTFKGGPSNGRSEEGERSLLFLERIKENKVRYSDNDYYLKDGTHYWRVNFAPELVFKKGVIPDEGKLQEFMSAIDEFEKLMKLKTDEEQLEALIISLGSPNYFVRHNAMLDIEWKDGAKYRYYPSIVEKLLKNDDPEVRLLGDRILKRPR